LPHIGVCAVQLGTEILDLKSKICQRANLPHRILFSTRAQRQFIDFFTVSTLRVATDLQEFIDVAELLTKMPKAALELSRVCASLI
jgi:hypothetical protein